MSQQEYNEWCRSVKYKLIKPWFVIKEAGSNESDSWGKVSIRADDQSPFNASSFNSVEQKLGLQQNFVSIDRAKRHAIN